MARLDRLAPVKEVAQIGAVHRPRVLPRAARRRRQPARGRSCGGARPAGRRRAGLPPRRTARCHLQLQACAGPGRRLRIAAQNPPPAAPARPSPRCSSAALPATRPETQPRTRRPSLHGGQPARRSAIRVLAEGWDYAPVHGRRTPEAIQHYRTKALGVASAARPELPARAQLRARAAGDAGAQPGVGRKGYAAAGGGTDVRPRPGAVPAEGW